MQIKSTVRYHLSPLRLATVRKTKTETENNKCYQGQGKLEPLCAIGGNVTVPPNIKNRIYIWCNDSTSEYKPRTESRVFMRVAHTVHISVTHNSQEVEATQVSTDRWTDKQSMVYTYSRILFSKSCHVL